MEPFARLKNAPLREAIIDIRFESRVTIDELKAFIDTLGDDYGSVSPIIVNEIHISGDKNGNPNSIREGAKEIIEGFVLRSDSYVFQIKQYGFSASKLAPYDTWDAFKDGVLQLWNRLSSILKVKSYTRVAVRYINQLTFPMGDDGLNLGDYLESPPSVPDRIGSPMNSFTTRVQVPFIIHSTDAVLIQASEGFSKEGDSLNVIVDIDVFRSNLSFSESELWVFFDTLRDIKNTVFFATITEKTKEMLDG